VVPNQIRFLLDFGPEVEAKRTEGYARVETPPKGLYAQIWVTDGYHDADLDAQIDATLRELALTLLDPEIKRYVIHKMAQALEQI
jgi:hypothetical protein